MSGEMHITDSGNIQGYIHCPRGKSRFRMKLDKDKISKILSSYVSIAGGFKDATSLIALRYNDDSGVYAVVTCHEDGMPRPKLRVAKKKDEPKVAVGEKPEE